MEPTNNINQIGNSEIEVGDSHKPLNRKKYTIGMYEIHKSATDRQELMRGFGDDYDLDETADSVED